MVWEGEKIHLFNKIVPWGKQANKKMNIQNHQKTQPTTTKNHQNQTNPTKHFCQDFSKSR